MDDFKAFLDEFKTETGNYGLQISITSKSKFGGIDMAIDPSGSYTCYFISASGNPVGYSGMVCNVNDIMDYLKNFVISIEVV